jgi:multiple sugar transport system permease protein
MKIAEMWKNFTSSKERTGKAAKVLSYIVLGLIAIAMLLPLLFLVNGSFQPSWQINAVPIVWVPREWNSVQAGETGRQLLLWWAKSGDVKEAEVIQIGARRYVPVVEPSQVKEALSVSKDQLSDAVPTDLGGIKLNIRDWQSPEGTRQVVALARDAQNENNLIVAEAAGFQQALVQYPLDEINKAKQQTNLVSGLELNTRILEDGRQVLVLGPESELTVVGSPEIAKEAELIQASRLGKKEYLDVGQTQLSIYSVEDKPEDYRAVAIVQENWQPLLPQSLVAEQGFIAKVDQLSEEVQPLVFNGFNMNVRTYTPSDGSAPYEVAVLIPGSTEFLVISTEFMDKLYAAPISDLVEPGSINLGTLTYRVQEDLERGDTIIPSALVGEIQDLALIVPSTSVKNAYDILPSSLERSTHVKLTITGYKRVLSLKLSGTPFWRFFVNSGYVVLMNIIGHFVSCTLVAYGFARFRGRGKNFLFVVLLGTMMIPGTIVILPTYLVFVHLGLLGTMVPLWIRSFFGNAFLIFILRQFFMAIPYELDEAAILDGANRLQVLLKVILPLSKPALATVGIFTFWWYWNGFLDPLIYITDSKYYTITLALSKFNDLYSRSAGYYDRILAGAVLSLLPIVIVFIFAQRYFIEGIQMQGLKR